MTRHLYRQNRKDIVYKFRPFEISIEELKVHEKGTFLIFRGSLLDDIKQIGDFKSSVLIYSMFKGYMQEPRFEAIKKFLKEKMTPIEILHTSGHASTKDLQALADKLNGLTGKQRAVAFGYMRGLATSEVAAQLEMSESSVSHLRARVCEALAERQ